MDPFAPPIDPATARVGALRRRPYDQLLQDREAAIAKQEALMAPPDTSAVADYGRARAKRGQQQLVLALAAQEAGQRYQPVQAHFLKQAAAARDPMKMGGGTITESGDFVADPTHGQDLAIRQAGMRVQSIERQIAAAESAQERAALQQERLDAQRALQEATRSGMAAIAGQASADRRYNADLAHQDRVAAREAAAAKNNPPPVDSVVPLSHIDNVITKAEEAAKKTSWANTGIIGGTIGKIPGTGAYDYAKQIDTIKANLGFDRLQQMREESKTGGALGQVAIKELEFLQASLDNLDTGQSPAAQRAALLKVAAQYKVTRQAYLRAQAEKAQRAGGAPPPAVVSPTPGGATGGWTVEQE